ncbi:hypothetical protein SmJEL517_g00452 [Synchytrium microbalum]|uniref:Uncharacterized protein n=1 Tax=Synchytrium microbalum TaxID=1806994 RepID=A0A507CD70_9FUNG|nr:uncharacterized protein SmJEL517_g00452 [Synchytrium microbalum]TPX37562.1 hypothetical protein SmJEL517_g00452 [Synchytrium microbalum]
MNGYSSGGYSTAAHNSRPTTQQNQQHRLPSQQSLFKFPQDLLEKKVEAANNHIQKTKQEHPDLFEQEIWRRAALRRTGMGETREGCLTSLAHPQPGPFDYDIKLPSAGPKFSILARHKDVIKGVTPAPTAYEVLASVAATSPHAPAISIAGKLDLLPLLVHAEGPSPGEHQNGESTIGQDKPKFTIAGRHDLNVDTSPGPKYFVDIKSSAPVFSFRVKPEPKVELLPGPTDYNIQIKSPVHAPAFNSRPKTSLTENLTEGPGVLYYPRLEWAHGNGVTLKGYHREFKPLQTPSPAQYKANSSLKGPEFTMTARQFQPDSKDVVPASTEYSPQYDASVPAPRAVTLKGRQSVAFAVSREITPSPAEYLPRNRQICWNDKPKATIKGRHETRIDDTPAPNAYSPYSPVVRPMTQATPQKAPFKKLSQQLQQQPAMETIDTIDEEDSQQQQHQQHENVEESHEEESEKKRAKRSPQTHRNIAEDCRPVTAPTPQIRHPQRGYTFGVRPNPMSELKCDDTPGPNAYMPPSEWRRKAASIKGRATPYMTTFTTNRFDTLRV